VNTPTRIVITSLATIVAFTASGWFGFLAWTLATIPFGRSIEDYSGAVWVQSLCSMGGAALAGWYTWRKTAAQQRSRPGVLAATIEWALIVGGVGFALGFFGPMIFTPGANQGPMLGIFITGPLGFVLGAVGGFVRSIRATTQASHQID
jgi:hypothetical protein